ncbi:MAG: ABC transporter ATP-binding protein [Lysobacteraceae bacterium]
MSGEAGIRARGVCLDVPLYVQRERRSGGWAGMLLGAAFDTPGREVVRLLDDVSFDLRPGDRIALLGRNGAGKSTLLRLLNNVYRPTRGSLEIHGSCQALLNISLGFSLDATVRENIVLRGVAMGLRAAFLREQAQAILDFSGLAGKANHRLRTLSSGQRVRLGFAISTSVQSDIMLMDEWVGTGDIEFMRRAKERLQDRLGGSKVVVLASHSLGMVREVCNRGLVLEQGRVVFDGDLGRALKHYQLMMADTHPEPLPEAGPAVGRVSGVVDDVEIAGGLVTVTGWALEDESRPVAGLAVELLGDRFGSVLFDRAARPDVQEHFGLLQPHCGFVVRIPAEEGVDESAVLASLQVASADNQVLRFGRKLRARAEVLGVALRGAARAAGGAA